MRHTRDPFRALYDANHERVRSVLARIVGPQDVDDLTQAGICESGQSVAALPW